MVLGVPILKHFRVSFVKTSIQPVQADLTQLTVKNPRYEKVLDEIRVFFTSPDGRIYIVTNNLNHIVKFRMRYHKVFY